MDSNEIVLKNMNPQSSEAISLMLQEDLASLPRITLRRVKNPSGGTANFTIKDENGEDTPVKELKGVVVHHHPSNAYWLKGQGVEDSLMCQSINGINGFGSPGGICSKCELNRFPADKSPKPCKNFHTLYLLPKGEAMPMIVTIPPTSLNQWAKFLSEVLGPHQKPTKTVEISIKLSIHKEAGKSLSWAVFNFSTVRDLEQAEILDAINKCQVVKMMQAQRAIELSNIESVSNETEEAFANADLNEVAGEIVASMKKDPVGLKQDAMVKTPRDAKKTLMQMVLQKTKLGTDNQAMREVVLEIITGKAHTTDMTDADVDKFLKFVTDIQGTDLDMSPAALQPVANTFFELFSNGVEYYKGGN